MNTEILLAEDHPLLRRSIVSICRSMGYTLVEVSTCKELLEELRRKLYTHLILDLTLGDGSVLNALPEIVRLYPSLRILVFSSEPNHLYRNSLRREYGIHYFVSKTEAEAQTIEQLLDFIRNKPPKKAEESIDIDDPLSILSDRESAVLPYLVKGWNSHQIAERFDISPSTVRTIKERILGKTNTRNVKELSQLVKPSADE